MRLFSLADFRRLWFVGLAICIVRWLEMLALALFAYQLTGSAFVVAMLTMLRLLPMGLFGAVIGAAAERLDRRRALVLVVSTSMVVTLTLAILASLGAIEVWHLAVASFINGVGWAADHPVRRMMIGDAVGAERIGAALSVDAATNNGTRVLGPMLSGLLLAEYGITSVFWFSLALYAPALVAALRIGMRRQTAAARPASFVTSIREGLAWLHRDRRLIGVFVMTIIFNVFGWPATSMVPVIGTDYLGLGPKGVGLLASCDGVGGLLGALLIAAVARAAWYGRIFVSAVALYLVMVVFFATAPGIPVAAVCAVPGRDVRRRIRRHAGDARLSRRAGRDARAPARRGFSVHRHGADRVSLPRLSRRDVHASHRDRGARGAGGARDTADAALLAWCIAALSNFVRQRRARPENGSGKSKLPSFHWGGGVDAKQTGWWKD